MGIVARDSSDLGVDSLAIGARGGAGVLVWQLWWLMW